MRTNRIEEVTVVTYNQHSMFKVSQIIFQPHHCFHIEVIGRLIQQQVIRITEKCLCQHDTYFLLTTQITHQQIMLIFLNAQPTQQSGSITFRIPTIQFRKFLFQFRNFQAIFIREIFFSIKHFTLLHDIPQNGMPHHYGIHYRKRIPLEVVLT